MRAAFGDVVFVFSGMLVIHDGSIDSSEYNTYLQRYRQSTTPSNLYRDVTGSPIVLMCTQKNTLVDGSATQLMRQKRKSTVPLKHSFRNRATRDFYGERASESDLSEIDATLKRNI